MQPQSPFPSGPQQPGGGTQNGLQHPEENYTAPQFGQDTGPTVSPEEHHDYSFIMNPKTPSQKPAGAGLSGLSGSLVMRLVIAGGGALVLLMAFVILKSALSGGKPNTAALLSVAQEQQELLHVTNGVSQAQGTSNLASAVTLNSAYTILGSVTTSQQKLFKYFSINHFKFSSAELNAKVSKTVDSELTTAATNGTYDQTYQSVMQSVLTNYGLDLKQAYSLTTGVNGRALLKTDYSSQQLMLLQINSPAS